MICMLCTVSQIQNIDIHLVMLMVYYLVMKIISFLLKSGLGIHSFALLFFALWLLSLFLKERPERIALVALYLKSDSCNSFLSLFAKRATGANIIFKLRVTGAIRSLQKNDSLFLRVIHFKCILFTMLFHFYVQYKRLNHSSSLFSLFSLFEKEEIALAALFKENNNTLYKNMKKAVCSCRSLQK